jgi:uncharacterized protein (DUF1684 family)
MSRSWVLIAAGLLIGILIINLLIETPPKSGTGDYFQYIEQKRDAIDRFMRTGNEAMPSPIPDSIRPRFQGLKYYETNLRYKFMAEFTPQDTVRQAGLLRAGRLQFEYSGKPHILTAFWEEGAVGRRLFVPFRDSTSLAGETYGGGRYVGVDIPEAWNEPNKVVLDFNLAYHPYCVYNPTYVCPVPPPENNLPFGVLAGEKKDPAAWYNHP